MKRQNVEKSKRQKAKAPPVDVTKYQVGSIDLFRGQWWVIERVTRRSITLRPAPLEKRTVTVEVPVHEVTRGVGK